MIDNNIALAHTVFTNKGIHALLLGSGISRAAEIPTGWEIMINLIQKVAVLENSDSENDHISWWQNNKKVEPSYSTLLETLAKTPSERRAISNLLK